jgi:hypothetical protein
LPLCQLLLELLEVEVLPLQEKAQSTASAEWHIVIVSWRGHLLGNDFSLLYLLVILWCHPKTKSTWLLVSPPHVKKKLDSTQKSGCKTNCSDPIMQPCRVASSALRYSKEEEGGGERRVSTLRGSCLALQTPEPT